jgi:signal peptidase I
MFASTKKILQAIINAPGKISDRITSKWVLVVGHSMHPVLHDRQRVRVSRRAYHRAKPARWDVALFEHPQRERFWETKRIIGLPSETVRLIAGRLYIDAVQIEDPFIVGTQPRLDRYWELKDNEFIVMGDNRRRSNDSRSFGPVPRRNIVGKVMIEDTDTEDTVSLSTF